MKKAAAIVTNRGGRTCHAAMVSRELGFPSVVGTEHGFLVEPDIDSISLNPDAVRKTTVAILEMEKTPVP